LHQATVLLNLLAGARAIVIARKGAGFAIRPAFIPRIHPAHSSRAFIPSARHPLRAPGPHLIRFVAATRPLPLADVDC
jgi:hypothetical protein